jgi:hypothetical protein
MPKKKTDPLQELVRRGRAAQAAVNKLGAGPPKKRDVHRQALLAAALIAAEVRDEAEDTILAYAPTGPATHAQCYTSGWYQAADKIAKRIRELADSAPFFKIPRRRARAGLPDGWTRMPGGPGRVRR